MKNILVEIKSALLFSFLNIFIKIAIASISFARMCQSSFNYKKYSTPCSVWC